MVREIGVHDDHEVAAGILEAMDVRGAEAEFAGAGFQDDALGGVEFLELFGDGLGAIWGGVVNYYEFPIERTEIAINYYVRGSKAGGVGTFP